MTAQAVHDVAAKYGRPIIRSCYRWADHHVRHQICSDALWRRGQEIRGKMFVQHQELAHLQKIISSTSQEESHIVRMRGVLTAANVTAKTFQFSVIDAPEIRGTFDDAISHSHAVTIPATYTASLRRTSSFNYAMDEEKESYVLLGLDP